MSEVCVVHLVWAPLGTQPFADFIASYRQHTAGIDHHLLLVFNGFGDKRELSTYYDLVDGLTYSSLLMPHPMLDIPAYFAAARSVDHEHLCFLNSYSVILDDGWLMKMHRHLTQDGVGLVGATGSNWSHYSNFVNTSLREGGVLLKDVWRLFYKRVLIKKYRLYFSTFPNPHIRTNAFMLSREVMLKLKVGALKNKLDAHRFESGKNSLTRQIMEMNLKALVVGRDGKAYDKEHWFESRTFWIGDQDNLLVADNRTREYMEADQGFKEAWSTGAWGKKR